MLIEINLEFLQDGNCLRKDFDLYKYYIFCITLAWLNGFDIFGVLRPGGGSL